MAIVAISIFPLVGVESSVAIIVVAPEDTPVAGPCTFIGGSK